MNKALLSLAFVSSLALGQSEPLQTSATGGVSLYTQQTITGAKTFSATLTTSAGIRLSNNADTIKWSGTATLESEGTGLKVTGYLNVTDTTFGIAANVMRNYSGGTFAVQGTTKVNVDAPSGFQITSKTLPTCAAAIEWTLLADAASGVSTAKVSKLCLCVSSGSATYTWRNVLTNTNGTATTCGTE